MEHEMRASFGALTAEIQLSLQDYCTTSHPRGSKLKIGAAHKSDVMERNLNELISMIQ